MNEVTELLRRAPTDPAAVDRLMPLVYEELRRLAASYLHDERHAHTLQPTALVHDAYIKLVGHQGGFNDRNHFFAAAAVAMRRLLVDHARRRLADKRGGGAVHTHLSSLDHLHASAPSGPRATILPDHRMLEIDEALKALAEKDPRRARVFELRVFGGMTLEQVAEVLSLARSTVADDWAVARAVLATQLA